MKKNDAGGAETRGLGGGWANFQSHWHGEPAPDLAPFVAHYWSVHWDLRGQEPYRQLIPPSVGVHVSFVDDQPGVVHGPGRRFSHRVLSDAGHVFGVAFRPGGFRPFLDGPVSLLVDRSVPVRAVFGRALSLGTGDPASCAVAAEECLRVELPPVDPRAAEASRAVELIAAEPTLVRVDELAERLGVGVRYLQRLFADHVGPAPKWCIRRYRLAEVTARLAAGAVVDWASLAAELGYADQAHFSRDFTAILGEPPSRYALRYP